MTRLTVSGRPQPSMIHQKRSFNIQTTQRIGTGSNSIFYPQRQRSSSSVKVTCGPTHPDAKNLYGARSDGIHARAPSSPSRTLINDDLSPATKRTFSSYDMTALWIGLVICVPSYALAAGLIDLGMSLTQGVLTVFLGNAITLLPMVLNGAAGCKYGLPFPVLCRASFGVHGALFPAAIRGAVACGWFGLQTWLGGAAVHQVLQVATGHASWLTGPVIGFLGISLPQFACFTAFWAVQLAVLMKGMEGVRLVERYGAPLLVVMCACLWVWAITTAGGWNMVLNIPSQFAAGMPKEGQFWKTFLPALTANVGFWSTLALNIPDFTRFAKSQKAQIVGQTVGLPVTMAVFAFFAMTVTAATKVIFGSAIPDPIELVGHLNGVLPITAALAALVLATLTTNLAANIIGPVNALVAADPERFNFQTAAIITSIIGFVIQPWRLIASTDAFIFKWLIGSSVFLAPIAGILLVDFYILRKGRLNIDALYSASPQGRYYYKDGWNNAAVWSVLIAALPSLPGFIHEVAGVAVPAVFRQVYNAAWFVGCGLGALVYFGLMTQKAKGNVKGAQGTVVPALA